MTTVFNARTYRDSETALALDDVLARFPVLRQTAPHASRSERYGFISSEKPLRVLAANGFTIHGVRAARTKRPDAPNSKAGFQRHSVTLRIPGMAFRNVGDVIPQINWLNSHDGSSVAEFMLGFFRLWCSNGASVMIGGTRFRVMHRGANVESQVLEAARGAVESFAPLGERIDAWRTLTLSADKQEEFAERALALRFASDETAPVTSGALLTVRRHADTGNDMWTVYNRIQENLIRGGMRGIVRNENGSTRRTSLRAIGSVARETDLNVSLFNLADEISRAA